ncbi:hypothetical protein D3C72_1534780 [compost metagenome]
MLQHGNVQQVLQARLVVTVEVGHVQHVVRLIAPGVQMACQKNLVLRQRTGLVRAQHIHGTEVLDGVQPFDDDLLARQKHRALGERGGHDHRQHLGRETYRHRQRKQQRLGPVTLGEAIDGKHQRHHDKHETDQHPADLVDTGLECGWRPVHGRGTPCQRPQIGAVARGHHHRRARARHHIRAHEDDVVQIHRIALVCALQLGELLDRH